jgi:hypothetical protein
VLTTEQFLCTVKVEVGKLQDLWAGASGILNTKAKELFNKELGDLLSCNRHRIWRGQRFDSSRCFFSRLRMSLIQVVI